MKTLKTTLLLLAILIANTTFSQTKEETIKYINDIISISKGKTLIFHFSDKPTGFVIYDSQKLTLNDFSYSSHEITSEGEVYFQPKNYSKKIPWVAMKTFYRAEVEEGVELTSFIIEFETPIDDLGNKRIRIAAIPSKATNVEKALKHLQELLKKEDPFGN